MWEGRGRAAVTGIGMSEISRDRSRPLGALVIEACESALADAGLSPQDVDGIATYPSAGFRGSPVQEGVETVGVSYLIDHLAGLDNVRWFSECSSGLVVTALIDAVNAIAAGACRAALVWRGMSLPAGSYSKGPQGEVTGEAEFLAPYGLHAPVQSHALAYQRYMARYGATREEMAALTVNSRKNASLNDRAFFRNRELTVEDYLSARMISSPLCLFDCDVPVFGAAAIVLVAADRARDCAQPPAYVIGMGQQAVRQPHHAGPLYTMLNYMESGARIATSMWESAGIGPDDVDVAQLYDGFSPSVYYWLESAGFCAEGEAHSFIQDGRITLTGKLPLNTFGGSLSEGRMHGMGHIIEAVRQVTGRAGPRQVADAEVAAVFDGSPMLRGGGLVFSGGVA